MIQRRGYRGYIGSRRYFGDRAPQHVQNLVIRDFCTRNGYTYLLSATEYAMENCYLILEDVMRELPQLDGIVLYSIFMLPPDKARRESLVDRIFSAGCSLHGAVENISIRNSEERRRLNEIWGVKLLNPAD